MRDASLFANASLLVWKSIDTVPEIRSIRTALSQAIATRPQDILSIHHYMSTVVGNMVAVVLHTSTDMDCGMLYFFHLQEALNSQKIVETNIDRSLIRSSRATILSQVQSNACRYDRSATIVVGKCAGEYGSAEERQQSSTTPRRRTDEQENCSDWTDG